MNKNTSQYEVKLQLHPDVANRLAEQALAQGFTTLTAYLRWIIHQQANRPRFIILDNEK